MVNSQNPASLLAERLCRPQRVGVFGHRGVGKTTLLTLLYREGVGGRLPGLRLAAANARTAEYLADKVGQLEAGRPVPATLAETDLRFHLYHQATRLDLLLKDYQGEHVELGREEPVRDFLRDCDAVWLCLDAGLVGDGATRLRRQQEVEQVVEDYLATDPPGGLHRPMALVLTKADRLEPSAVGSERWADEFGMTRHALQSHCPQNAQLAVSCLKEVLRRSTGESTPGAENSALSTQYQVHPSGLTEVLTWLTGALQAQDEARLEWLFAHAGRPLPLLARCVASFARRYPAAPATAAFRQRLRRLRRLRFQRRGTAAAAAAACLALSVWGYDAWGYQAAQHFEQDHASAPEAVLASWQSFQAWHPTRHLTRTSMAEAEEARLADLRQQARQVQCDECLAELRRRAADADADPEDVWRMFQAFHADYPEVSVAGDLEQLRSAAKARRDANIARRAQRAYDELLVAEQRLADPASFLDQADDFLARYPGTPPEAEVRRKRDAYLARLDERCIEVARTYSAKNSLNFQTRREHYQRYLDRYPTGAAAAEAKAALRAIEADWDRHDFRLLRDHFQASPGDMPELVARCRTYLAVHPQGRFAAAAAELLRWSERVTAPGEYRVVLKNGHFEKKVARFFSRGPDLSVELEVGGARYGPSSFYKNQYDPSWEYEYPRRVRWKLGDPVVIRVIDNDWRRRVVLEWTSEVGDPLALRLLTGDVWIGGNRVTFETDFTLPVLPVIE